MAQSDREQAAADGYDELADAEEEPEEDDLPPAQAVPFRWLGPTLVLAGAACIVFGAIWAGVNWLAIRECSETAEGVFVGYVPQFFMRSSPPPEIPAPAGPTGLSVWYEVQYAYAVKGRRYSARDRDSGRAASRVTIHYDPRHPETHFIGSVTPPWLILFAALGLGAFLAFIGCSQGWNRPPG